MVIFNWKIVIIILVALVVADKLITVANINAVKKNFPKIDPLSIERNPLAKWFFQKCGLVWGTILYGIVSIITILIFMFLINSFLKSVGVTNSLSVSLWIAMVFYGIVILNNLYFLLKYSKIVP